MLPGEIHIACAEEMPAELLLKQHHNFVVPGAAVATARAELDDLEVLQPALLSDAALLLQPAPALGRHLLRKRVRIPKIDLVDDAENRHLKQYRTIPAAAKAQP